MGSKTLIFKSVTRRETSGAEEVLRFTPGLNVIVGRPNSGKTKWLEMIDYLLGTDESAASAMGLDISEKYDSVSAEIVIGGDVHVIERNWKKSGFVSKVLFDDESMPASSFSSFLLNELDIPVLHFPQGNPYSPRKWPELSWNSLYRHIYRQQRFWSDIADRQPPGDQLACVLQFLGAAEFFYSRENEEFVALNKKLLGLQAAKDQFNEIIADFYRNILAETESIVDPTPEVIDAIVSSIRSTIEEKIEVRDSLINGVINDAKTSSLSAQIDMERLSGEWEEAQSNRAENDDHLSQALARLNQLHGYENDINAELARLARTRDAVDVLADIQATHCPVCDQPVTKGSEDSSSCYMCHQPWVEGLGQSQARRERIEFEEHQLTAEKSELEQLISSALIDIAERHEVRNSYDARLRDIETQMLPIRQSTAMILPPEISRIDMEIGSLKEKLRLCAQLGLVLKHRENRSREIDDLSIQLNELSARINEMEGNLDLESRSDRLRNGMNSYLTALNLEVPGVWSLSEVSVNLRQKSFQVLIGGEKWSQKTGGTLTHYLLLSYHYSLLSLSYEEGYHYPGLVILDFPAPIEDTESIADKENFVLNPFARLLHTESMADAQMIVAGAAFEGLAGAHRIELTSIWK